MKQIEIFVGELFCAVKRMISAFGGAIPSGDSQTLNAQERDGCLGRTSQYVKTLVLWATFGKQNWRYGMNRKQWLRRQIVRL